MAAAPAFQMDLSQFDEAFGEQFAPSDRTIVLETIDLVTRQLEGLAQRLLSDDTLFPLGDNAARAEHVDGGPMGQSTFDLLVGLTDQLSMAAGRCGQAAHDAGTHHAWGFSSASALAAHRTHLSKFSTHRMVRRARTETEFVEFAQARREQRISGDHLDPLGRLWHDHPSVRDLLRRDEAVLLEAALALSPAEFAKACRHWLALADPDAADAAYLKRHLDRGITFIRRLDGSIVFSGEADAIRGELIVEAIERSEQPLATADRLACKGSADTRADTDGSGDLADDPLGTATLGDPERTPRQRRIDALCNALVDGAATPAGAQRPEPLVQLVVGEEALHSHLERALRRELGETDGAEPVPPGELGDLLRPGFGTRTRRGHAVPTAAAIAAMIHGRIMAVTTSGEGVIIDAGRARRLFSAIQKQLLALQHGRCVYPGCDHPAHRCQMDHLLEWASGGETNLSNGAPMCPNHHGLKNDGFFTVDWDADGNLIFIRFDGTLIT